MKRPINLLKTKKKENVRNVNKDSRYLAVFLISRDKNF